jgi:hypothetical protein
MLHNFQKNTQLRTENVHIKDFFFKADPVIGLPVNPSSLLELRDGTVPSRKIKAKN